MPARQKEGTFMKQIRSRLVGLALAVCLVLSVAAPVSAEAARAAAVQPAGSVLEALMDVPILGSILRFFAGDEEATAEDASTPEGASTAEDAATPENATPEDATPENATEETAQHAVITPDSWAAGWMVGSVSPRGQYPAGNPEAQPALTPAAQLWTEQSIGDAATSVAYREETNFGDLVADAMSYAVASGTVWKNTPALQGLPLVSIVDGASFLKNVPAGTTLTAENLSEYLEDSSLSLFVVTPYKLHDILNYALEDMLETGEDNSGSFPQISGLRFTYQTINNDRQLVKAWLPGLDGETELRLDDDTAVLALVIPSDLVSAYGLDGEGYVDYLAQAAPAVMTMSAGDEQTQPTALTVHSALLDLPKNADAATLAALLARQGSLGRSLPVTAGQAYTVSLETDKAVTNCTVEVYVDGVKTTARIDGEGRLIIENLSYGSHTIRLTSDGAAWFVSSISGLGETVSYSIGALPAGTVTQPLATPMPSPTPAPAGQAQTQTVTAQGAQETESTPAPTPTPTPAPAAPAATATPRPARTAAPVEDPMAGTIIGVTPAPTMTPTPTPSPTPEPTLSPEEQQKVEETAELSSRLPLYVGIGVLVLGAAVVAVVLIRRRMEEAPKPRRTYHSRKK